MINSIKEKVFYIGANDYDLDLFEGQYIVPNGMAYNSYLILDEKVAVMDSIEKTKTGEWLDNIKAAAGGRTIDYLIVQHMEPDHSASIKAFAEEYPEAVIVGNKKTFTMIGQFFNGYEPENKLVVNNGDTLSLGSRSLTFLFAPMVHWPEVMMTYESTDKILFSADAFGKFGTLDTDEDWACEARRYYIGIVGKYGAQVQAVLKKVADLEVETICPLHGPVLSENLDYYMDLYNTWSSYEAETEGVCICYTSVYGNTAKAVELLAEELEAQGVETVVVNDLARCDWAEAIEDAFRYDRLVLATTTYNSEIFPFMKQFIDHLLERNYQNRRVAFIENGSWAPAAMKIMKGYLSECKGLDIAENNVTIKSAMSDANIEEIKALAAELAKGTQATCGAGADETVEDSFDKASDVEAESGNVKKFRCNLCGYEYEGAELPADYECPLCGRGADDFSLVE